MRNDTSTIMCDNFILNELILKGMNLSFEELPYLDGDLEFKTLEKELI